jgi:cyanate permease
MLLISADAVLAASGTIWGVAFGTALWGLQIGATQAVLGAIIADATPDHLRGIAFGIYGLSGGLATFTASTGAGALWAIGGPAATFSVSACIAIATALILLLQPSLSEPKLSS